MSSENGNLVVAEGEPDPQVAEVHAAEWLTWDDIYRTVAKAAGVANPHLVHVPSEVIARRVPSRTGGLLGDKTNSSIFDNLKVKRAVPEKKTGVPTPSKKKPEAKAAKGTGRKKAVQTADTEQELASAR